jgi:spermidine/putrescine-binding protein
MKKIPVFMGMAAAIFLLAGCGKNADKLYIYNWTYYTPDTVIEKFEEEYKVTVIYDEFASNEDMYAKIKAGGSGYDIVFPSGDYVSIMIQQNMLERIDKSKNTKPEKYRSCGAAKGGLRSRHGVFGPLLFWRSGHYGQQGQGSRLSEKLVHFWQG